MSSRSVRRQTIDEQSPSQGGPGGALARFPPLVGLFHASACRVELMESGRARAIAAEAAVQGAEFGLFGTTDIDFAAGAVRYLRLTPDGWSQWRGPIPAVVLRGAPFRNQADFAAAERLRSVAPFANHALPDKSTVSTTLNSTVLAPHVIPFRPVQAPDAGTAISAFLDEHRRAVLKPARASRGRGIAFVARDAGDIVVHESNRRWRVPAEEGLAELASRVGSQAWIIQALIVSRVRDGRVFDIRVHVHKDGNGRWALVRSYARLSEAGLLVSNTSQGGYQGDLEPFFAGLGDRGMALAATIRRLGLQVAEALDTIHGGELDELGVDVLIDPQLWPWIAEVNSGPQSRFHEFERARFAMAYALHLARRRGAGEEVA